MPKWSQKGNKTHPKMDAKIDEIWSAFLDGNSITKWSQNGGQNPLKIDEKCFKNPIGHLFIFLMVFLMLFQGFWRGLDP